MANYKTGAQRHNDRQDKIWAKYYEHQSKLPPAHLYGRFLELAQEKLKITKEEARKLYGQYTVQQWENLLSLGWGK